MVILDRCERSAMSYTYLYPTAHRIKIIESTQGQEIFPAIFNKKKIHVGGIIVFYRRDTSTKPFFTASMWLLGYCTVCRSMSETLVSEMGEPKMNSINMLFALSNPYQLA